MRQCAHMARPNPFQAGTDIDARGLEQCVGETEIRIERGGFAIVESQIFHHPAYQ